MKIIKKSTNPKDILKEVQTADNSKDFNLFTFCKLYKHQTEELPWKKMCNLFNFLIKKKININYLEFTLPEKEKLKGYAKSDNELQYANNPGLATMVKFLMEDKQITQLEERVLFWINKNINNNVVKNNAKEKIINGNKKILFYFIKKLKFKLEHDNGEMLTEGYVEMRKMFDKFMPETNYKFLSYAQWSIYQVMKKTICDEQNLIQIPLNVLNLIYKLNNFLNENSDVIVKEKLKKFQISNKISNKTMKMLLQYHKNFGKCSSIDSIIKSDNNKDNSFEQLLVKNNVDTIKTYNKSDEIINQMNKILTKEELFIIEKTFGINCDKLTKKQINELMPKLSVAQISNLYKSALNKLRKNKNCFSWLLEE